MNVPKIKGTHTAMKSGMLAAEAVAEALAGDRPAQLTAIRKNCAQAGCGKNCRGPQHPPGFRQIRVDGRIDLCRDGHLLLRGKAPWTFHHPHPDNETLLQAEKARELPIRSPTGC